MARRVALVLSTIFRVHGGIPRFNRALCRALDDLSDELGLEGRVLSQDDSRLDYERAGAPWKRLEFVAGGGGPYRLAVRTAAVCLRERPEALIIGLLGMTPLGLACRPLTRRGYAFVAHGTEAWEERRPTRRLAARHAARVFAVSRDTAAALVRSTGVPADRVRWLPNCLDPALDTLASGPSLAIEEGLEVLTVSRLWSEELHKGVDHALRAFAGVAPRYPRARYRIVGKGSDKPRLVALAATLGLADRVTFEEDLSDAQLAERYRRCAVFVLPSGQEGFGIVFLEAMRFGKPCVGVRAGGAPEVVEDGRTGLLVGFTDQAGLEAALDRLLGDADLRRLMGEAGRHRVLETFTFERFRGRLRQALVEWLGSP